MAVAPSQSQRSGQFFCKVIGLFFKFAGTIAIVESLCRLYLRAQLFQAPPVRGLCRRVQNRIGIGALSRHGLFS